MTDQSWIVMPVRDDWEACGIVLERLDDVLARTGRRASVLLVDDGSQVEPSPDFPYQDPESFDSIEKLRLVRNLGHQRAICVGLCHLRERGLGDPIVVMDADGEDDPEDVARLLDAFAEGGGDRLVFAERIKRSESLSFKVSYWLYRKLHHFLTGHRVRVGNFSVLSAQHAATLVVSPKLWSHYAASVFESGVPYATVPTPRAERVMGQSKMNFTALVMHGLSAISVFNDVVGVRLFLLTILAAFLASIGLAVVVGMRLFSGLAIPGWATYASGILLILIGLAVMTAIGLSLLTLGGRRDVTSFPIREYSAVVESIETLHPSD